MFSAIGRFLKILVEHIGGFIDFFASIFIVSVLCIWLLVGLAEIVNRLILRM